MRLLLNPRYTSTLPEGINYYYKATNIYIGEYSNQQQTITALPFLSLGAGKLLISTFVHGAWF